MISEGWMRGEAEVEPAARAVAHVAEERHADQQRQAHDVDRHREAHQQSAGGCARTIQSAATATREVAPLADHAVDRSAAGGRVDHGDAERERERERGHERAVDAAREELEGAANHCVVLVAPSFCLTAGRLPSRW